MEGFDSNILGLSIETQIDMDDDPVKVTENTVLNCKIGDNEIVLGQHVERAKTNEIISKEKRVNEFTYDFMVIDHKVHSTMFYKVELARVEINQDKDKDNNVCLGERLEVIAKLDEDDDNPFETTFDEPKS